MSESPAGVIREPVVRDPLKEAHRIARKEYAQASARTKEIEGLDRVLREFHTSLNRASWDRTREDKAILGHANIVKGNTRALNEGRRKKGLDILDDLDEELSVAERDLSNVEIEQRPQEIERRTQERERRRSHNETLLPSGQLQAEARREVFEWFKGINPGVVSLLDFYITHKQKSADTQKIQELKQGMHNQIADCVASWMLARNSLGSVSNIVVKTGPNPEDLKGNNSLEERVMQNMGQFLIENAPSFKDISSVVRFDQFDQGRHLPYEGTGDKVFQFWDDIVNQALLSSRIQEAVLFQDPNVATFVTREWLHRNGTEARDGRVSRRIYETPHYKKIIESIRFEGAKKNGVGGVIVEGPPGVGKTEILQEANKQEGYGTRMIGIHYYANVAELLGEKKMQIKGAGGTIAPESIAEIVKLAEGETGESFAQIVKSMWDTLNDEGKIMEGQTFTDFVKSLVSNDAKDILVKQEFSGDDWDGIRESFILKQKTRIARMGLRPEYQETVADIVAGEILLAIESGQRAVLDEVDKSGPNSLGGLLTFTSKRPGSDVLQIGETRIEIPSWFRVDATSNAEKELGSAFNDRFSHIYIDTPPVKDQLMIAAVRLSDHQGNILISPYEQRQMVGFMTYVMPEINKILQTHEPKMEPISLRSLNALANYLVNFENMSRTDISFAEAVQRLLLQNRGWQKEPSLANSFTELASRYKEIFSDRPRDFARTPFVATQVFDRGVMVQETLQGVIDSPLLKAINGMVDKADKTKIGTVRKVKLTEDDAKRLEELPDLFTPTETASDFNDNGTLKDSNSRKLPTGFRLKIEPSKAIHLDSIAPENENAQRLLNDQVTDPGIINGVSLDGRVAVIAQYSQDGATKDLSKYELFGLSQAAKPGEKIIQGVTSDSRVVVAPGGDYVFSFSRKDQNNTPVLRLHKAGQVIAEGEGVESFSLSDDGKFILIKGSKGTTISRADNMGAIARLSTDKNNEWKFAKNNMIVGKDQDGGIIQDAFLLIA